MSNNTSDYSFLIQSIEGKLNAAAAPVVSQTQSVSSARQFTSNVPFTIPETPSHRNHDLSLSAIAANTSAKKRRISELILEDADADDFTMNTREFKISAPPKNLSANLKLQMQVDELKLLNEQLKEQLKSYKAEHDLFKDQSARQLKFLEDLNAKYKGEVDAARQKYYDEKKKWQTKLRESEDTNKKLQERMLADQQQQAAQSSSQSSLEHSFVSVRQQSSSSAAAAKQSADALRRIQSLETMIADTQAESRRNLQLKLDADETISRLEQQLKLATSTASSRGDHDDLSAEHRQLRKQFQELETNYRRKCKEADKLQQQVKNQNMLEEELASTVTKLRLAQETVQSFHAMELEHRRLVEDRKTWHQLFQPLLAATTAANGGGGGEDVSASRAVAWVHETQQQCLVLQSRVGDLERSVTTLRQTLLKSEARSLQLDKERVEAQTLCEKLTAKQSLWGQQSRLYEAELQSLRTLLQSFDVEFSIGKPEAVKLLAAKETIIDGLRRDVDEARRTVHDVTQQLLTAQQQQHATQTAQTVREQSLTAENTRLQQALEEARTAAAAAAATAAASSVTAAASAATATESDVVAELKRWKENYKALEEVSGVDYLPHRTQILHLKLNPTTPFFGSTAAATGANAAAAMDVDGAADAVPSSSSETPSSLPTETVKRYRVLVKQLETRLQQALETIAKLSTAAETSHDPATVGPAAGSQSPNASMLFFGAANTSILGGGGGGAAAKATTTSGSSSGTSSTGGGATGSGGSGGSAVDQAKLNQRLKEMFKEKISTFREAVYLLTGYKMELYSAEIGQGKTVNRLKIRSMYAEAPEDCLIFQLSENGPELLESDFANRMDETLIQHLQRYQSVPAFLANVTLTLFENSTFMG